MITSRMSPDRREAAIAALRQANASAAREAAIPAVPPVRARTDIPLAAEKTLARYNAWYGSPGDRDNLIRVTEPTQAASEADLAADIMSMPRQPKPNPTNTSGVYFLFSGDEIVYIGQSIQVTERILTHTASKDFDAWLWVSCPRDELLSVERAYLDKYLPRLNTDIITRKKRLQMVSRRATSEGTNQGDHA